jgi:methylmalonyl-CoA mutase
MNEKDINLFSEFPSVTTESWESQIRTDLKGKDYDKALVWPSHEGIKVRPYYRQENLESLGFLDSLPGYFPYVRGNHKTGNNWLVRQDIRVSNFSDANKKALEVVSKGVNSIGFVFTEITVTAKDQLHELLMGIDFTQTEVNFILNHPAAHFWETLSTYLRENESLDMTGSVNFDPIGQLVSKGRFYPNEADALNDLYGMLVSASNFPNLELITLDGLTLNNGGANSLQEIAFVLAIGVEYLTRLTDLGLDGAFLASRIRFNLGIGGNYFMELAKIRSVRMLWAQIVQAYNPKCSSIPACKNGECNCCGKVHIHSETSRWNKTIYDPYVNLLRSQTEAMSAALGGADSISLLPFNSVYEQPTDFSERIARNQQIILKEEAHFDKIADPAAGSYYIEMLTSALSEQAWDLFLTIQDKGGFIAACRDGYIQNLIGEMASKRTNAVSSRRDNVLGINQFANPSEYLSNTLSTSLFQTVDKDAPDAEVKTIKLFRRAQHLEAIRYATDCYSLSHKRPVVYLLTVGDPLYSKARAQFASNFFGLAGYEIFDNAVFDTIESGVKGALNALADIVVLCSSDDEYALLAPQVHQLLVGKTILVIAGAPPCSEELSALGIKDFIHVKSDLIQSLTGFNNKLGIR